MNLSPWLVSVAVVSLLLSVSTQAASYSAAPQQRHHNTHYQQPAHELSNRPLLRYAPQYNQRQPQRYQHGRHGHHQRGQSAYHQGYQQGYSQGYQHGNRTHYSPQQSNNVIIIQRNR